MAVSTLINIGEDCKEKYGFFDAEKYVFKAQRGLSEEVVREISWMKGEPEWMTRMRLRYLMSRGIRLAEAETMIVNGFIEPFTKELPLEYAIELNRLIQLEMEGSVG